MRTYILLAVSIVIALSFVACGSKGGGDSVAAVPAPIVAPPPPNYYNPNRCQIGQVDAQGYGCLNRYSCQYGYGWVVGQGICVPGTPITEQSVYGTAYVGRFYGMLSIVNRAQFEKLLQYAGLCNPYWTGWNWGTWNCSTWSNQGFIELRTFGTGTGSNVNMFVGTGSPYTMNWQSTSSIGFSQTAAVVDYNNSAGMQIIGIGPNGQDVGLRVIVTTGRLTDNSFTGDVMYQNVKFATISFVRN